MKRSLCLILVVALIAPTAGCASTTTTTTIGSPEEFLFRFYGAMAEAAIRSMLGIECDDDEEDDDEWRSKFDETYDPYNNVRTAERRKREEELEKDSEEWLKQHVNKSEIEHCQVTIAPNEVEDQ